MEDKLKNMENLEEPNINKKIEEIKELTEKNINLLKKQLKDPCKFGCI